MHWICALVVLVVSKLMVCLMFSTLVSLSFRKGSSRQKGACLSYVPGRFFALVQSLLRHFMDNLIDMQFSGAFEWMRLCCQLNPHSWWWEKRGERKCGGRINCGRINCVIKITRISEGLMTDDSDEQSSSQNRWTGDSLYLKKCELLMLWPWWPYTENKR